MVNRWKMGRFRTREVVFLLLVVEVSVLEVVWPVETDTCCPMSNWMQPMWVKHMVQAKGYVPGNMVDIWQAKW